jgi:hypothetical protein
MDERKRSQFTDQLSYALVKKARVQPMMRREVRQERRVVAEDHQTVTWTQSLSRRSAGLCARLPECSFFGKQGLVGEVKSEADADQHQCISQAQRAPRKVLGCLWGDIVHVVIAGHEEQVRSLLSRLAFQAAENVPGVQISSVQDGIERPLRHLLWKFAV